MEEQKPPETWRGSVLEQWCDANGHLNLAYYVVAFDFATDYFYDLLNLGETYRKLHKKSFFTLESHVCYLSETFSGEEIYCNTQLIGFDKKRIHYFHRMYRDNQNILLATNELMAININLDGRKVEEIKAKDTKPLNEMMRAHRSFSRPTQLGSRMSFNMRNGEK